MFIKIRERLKALEKRLDSLEYESDVLARLRKVEAISSIHSDRLSSLEREVRALNSYQEAMLNLTRSQPSTPPAEQMFSVPVQGIPTAAPVVKTDEKRDRFLLAYSGGFGRQSVSLSDLVLAIARTLKIEWQRGTDGQLVSGKKAK